MLESSSLTLTADLFVTACKDNTLAQIKKLTGDKDVRAEGFYQAGLSTSALGRSEALSCSDVLKRANQTLFTHMTSLRL